MGCPLPFDIGNVSNSHAPYALGGLIGNICAFCRHEHFSSSKLEVEQPCYNSCWESCLDALIGKVRSLETGIKEVDDKFNALEETERKFAEMIKRVNRNKIAAKSKVVFNVQGHLFTATRKTFLQFDNTYFSALFHFQPEKGGVYFIDRDPVLFSHIIASLRDRSWIDFKGWSFEQIGRMRSELDYYLLPPWICKYEPTWDVAHDSPLTVSEEGHTVTKSSNNSHSSCAIATTPDAPSFRV